MQMDVATLTKLLGEFHGELKTCMENRLHELPDPILLGDFIVDTYNRYLAAGKSAYEHPIIQTMPEIEKLRGTDPVEYEIQKGVGNHPRLGKMREVAMGAKQLQTLLEGGVEMKADKAQRELAGVVTLLKNLGEQIGQVGVLDDSEASRQTVQHVVKQYNHYLATALRATDDSVIPKMFRPLTVGDERTSPHAKLSEVRLAQTGLLSYLRETPDIPRPIPYSQEDARNITDDEADWMWLNLPVPDPLGEDVVAFAAQSTLRGDENDVNAKVWATWETDDQDWETINGRWRGRCCGYDGVLSNDENWWTWKGQIREINGWVHIFMYNQAGPIIIKAKREGNRLVGRRIFLHDICVSGPWVGVIVDNRRIDGEYEDYGNKCKGRFDFRR